MFNVFMDLDMANGTREHTVDGLKPGVPPVAQLITTFALASTNGKRTPITPAYAFTDYHTQAQMLAYCVASVDSPLSG